ncbi:hypothetical protein [Jatrophihabitans sp.]
MNSQQELTLLFFALWRDGSTPPGVREPRRLCLACRTPFWQKPEATG